MPTGPSSVIYYKYNSDYTKYIVCTLDIKAGKEVQKYTSTDTSISIHITENEN